MSERAPVSAAPSWLRRAAGHRAVVPATALALRARTTTAPLAFALRELAGRRGRVAIYRSRAYDCAFAVRHRSGDAVTVGEVFHERDYEPPDGVPAPRRVLDIGANIGLFGAFALARWPGVAITAFEPDPSNAAIHARTQQANGAPPSWELVTAAAAAADGELRFSATGDALSRADAHGERVVAARDVLPLVADADLVKLDAEGGEWPILTDPRFAASPPRAIVLEYHPEGCPEPGDPRALVLRLLAGAGLTRTHELWSRDGYGVLWAWRT